MGECYCSNITIMQLFHELKQQFPALPDHIVSQCIAQNSHDKETCARSLRVTQESRPSPGAFPPRALDHIPYHQEQNEEQSEEKRSRNERPCPGSLNNGITGRNHQVRAHRPASLDIGKSFIVPRQCFRGNERVRRLSSHSDENPDLPSLAPSSAPPSFYPTRGFFDDYSSNENQKIKVAIEAGSTTSSNIPTSPNIVSYSPIEKRTEKKQARNRGNQSSSAAFELNVNVACSPAGNHDFRIAPTIGNSKGSDLVLEPRPAHYIEPTRLAQSGKGASLYEKSPDQTRSYTSVSLTLRPPSSEPQAPIDIRSQGSSLTYSTSSLDPRGFQSRLRISIGPGSVGSVASARIRPPMALPRPNTLLPHHQAAQQRPPGLPAGPQNQIHRPTTTMSAPTTPSAPVTSLAQLMSLPTTPSNACQAVSPPSPGDSPTMEQTNSEEARLPSYNVAEQRSSIITEQLLRKERLEKKLEADKGRLEAMRRELELPTRTVDTESTIEEVKRRLISEIYQLRLECDRLADEVDKRSDERVPLGETNEEFYQGIYTGQPLAVNQNYLARSRSPEPPPLPSRPPAWQAPPRINNVDSRQEEQRRNDDWDERDGPSWVCRMCTFDNHPLMDKCEQCDMPRILVRDTGETQDIHIRVTHHHNFNSPRRTVHSWVV